MTLFDLFFTAQAWASEAGVEHHAPSINEIWFPLGNFLIFAFILVRYALPLVRSMLQSRRADVLASIAESTSKKQAAEALVRDYRSRLATVDKEVATIQASLQDEAEREKEKLLADARLTATKIKDDARFLAEQEVVMARQGVRQELADRAEAEARTLLERNLAAADQSRLAQEFIESIGQAR